MGTRHGSPTCYCTDAGALSMGSAAAARAAPMSVSLAGHAAFPAAFQNAMMFPKRAMALRGGQDPAKEGDVVPDVIFKARVRDEKIGGDNPFTWKDVSTADLFKGKRVVIFSLPGAFTPTCSSTHLPG